MTCEGRSRRNHMTDALSPDYGDVAGQGWYHPRILAIRKRGQCQEVSLHAEATRRDEALLVGHDDPRSLALPLLRGNGTPRPPLLVRFDRMRPLRDVIHLG